MRAVPRPLFAPPPPPPVAADVAYLQVGCQSQKTMAKHLKIHKNTNGGGDAMCVFA